MSEQNYLILGAVNIGLCYLIYLLQEFRGLQIAVGAIILFNLATAFSSDLRHIVIDFMGSKAHSNSSGFATPQLIRTPSRAQPVNEALS